MKNVTQIDDRGRIAVGRFIDPGVTHFIVDRYANGVLILTPARIVPVNEVPEGDAPA